MSDPATTPEENLISFVLDALHKGNREGTYPSLKVSFPNFEPDQLFRTVVVQQSWVLVNLCKFDDAAKLLEELGENPCEHFYEMWRQTTSNRIRTLLYDYLRKKDILSPQDEEYFQILMKITSRYPNTSFTSAQRLNKSPAMKVITETANLPAWKDIIDLSHDFNENKAMILPHLFQIPIEPPVESPRYFLGNIALIESQPDEVLRLFKSDGSVVEKLWLMHCEHKIMEMAAMFKDELDKTKNNPDRHLECLKFVNMYYKQMNQYEQETLLDVLCQNGIFCEEELANFELLLIRICKNKALFDQAWWSKTTLNFTDFFKRYAKYCAEKNLYMPFEMFVISHSKAKEIDMSDVDHPLIRFIWDLWVKRDPSAATLSNMQYLAKSSSNDPVELWKSLPSDSLAPLASFVWNKDPSKFQPGSPEVEALSNRLKGDYPLLASLVKGEVPHPQSANVDTPQSKWRSPIFTSKYDLELHDLIASHFEQFDFSKVFTDYYGKTPGQPPFPHFDHPELITTPSEPPYVHYVKAMLPVSAFQQAIEDGVTQTQFKDLCFNVMKEALGNKPIRLAALTFVELTDLKFKTDLSVDFKLVISIYDYLSGTNDETLSEELNMIFNQKDQGAAKMLQKKLNPNDIDSFLLAALLGVRCGLPLDYSAISNFASKSHPAELLLFIDRAEEIGAHYSNDEVVKIIREEMPENPLKAHLLFHLTQVLPTPTSAPSDDIQPALVVFKALRRTDQPSHIALLEEALARKQQLYALLATSVEGSDKMTCAIVTLLTMTDTFSLDVANPPPPDQMARLFLQVVLKLLLDKKSAELLKAFEIFSETSITTAIAKWYNAVEGFAFRRAELALEKLNELRKIEEDDLIGKLSQDDVTQTIFPLQDALARQCAQKSQVHLFRYLELLQNTDASPLLDQRVKLSKIISKYENFRRAIVQTDLLSDLDKVVTDLVLHHSLALGQEVASSLGLSASSATQQWLRVQFSSATSPSQILEIQSRIASTVKDADYTYYVSLFASQLPYAQPSFVSELLKFARKNLGESLPQLTKQIDALLLHIKLCTDNSIDVEATTTNISTPPNLFEILRILFPDGGADTLPSSVALNIESPVKYSLDALTKFFDTSIDKTIDFCLDQRRVDDARLLCAWRHKNPRSIVLLDAVQKAISKQELSYDQQSMLASYGMTNDMQALLNSIARDNGWRFRLISLHYRAATILKMPTTDLLSRRTIEFINSSLPMMTDQWPLIRDMVKVGKLTAAETAQALVDAFVDAASGKTKLEKGPNTLSIDDYGEKFVEFTKLCETPTFVGDRLFTAAKTLQNENGPVPVIVNIILHASLCTADVDECADVLDGLLTQLTNEKQIDLIIKIVSVFQDPALLPRYFQYLISQEKLNALQHNQLSAKVGRVIMNCARHVHPFEPEKYFDLTLNYQLYRDHAELQMERGSRFLEGTPDKQQLQEASRHYLLALAYFLHEKCYSLSMECLKKLSLISLQLELSDPPVLHLTREEAIEMMCTKDFPFALTVAVAYETDTEEIWAQAIFEQAILKPGDNFLTPYQYFRPITANLCDGVVKRFKEAKKDDKMIERMKQFLLNIPNLVERYRVAKELDFKDQINTMKEVNPVVCEWCEKVLLNE
ncbi:hypothetical protein TRFO_27566 [Tritrichomonas foetus]|uniref:Spatacsin C-terminal domain-containing protein n=1 Tax=Tritrichomonas foetus TaxID=1144522 RepID=A0A1J4K5Z5_9EUKA|nr:hypothetical protein TRFO_27566 [Tritrichomonas foetus]|eukprot:OHT04885.1 hypothetical protein TRFO_27566 [Tritrichomonas foetus]